MHIRRQRMHREMRQQQIEASMHLRRMELTSSRSIFTELHALINSTEKEDMSMDLVRRLTHLLDTEDRDDTTYILVGNYMIDHPAATPYFKPYLLDNPHCLEYYFWAVSLVLESECTPLEMATIGDSLLSVLVEPSDGVWGYYIEIMCKVLEREVDEEHFPHSFVTGIIQYTRCCNLSSMMEYVGGKMWFIASKLTAYPTLLQKESIYVMLAGAVGYALQHLPTEREQCMRVIRVIFEANEGLCYEYILKSSAIPELLYLGRNSTYCQAAVLRTFNAILKRETAPLLIYQGVHLLLVDSVKMGVDNQQNDLVHLGLETILKLLRIILVGDLQIVQKVKHSMDKRQFTQVLQELLNSKGERIRDVATEIVDEFYTEDVD